MRKEGKYFKKEAFLTAAGSALLTGLGRVLGKRALLAGAKAGARALSKTPRAIGSLIKEPIKYEYGAVRAATKGPKAFFDYERKAFKDGGKVTKGFMGLTYASAANDLIHGKPLQAAGYAIMPNAMGIKDTVSGVNQIRKARKKPSIETWDTNRLGGQ